MHNSPFLQDAELDQGNNVCSANGRGVKKVQVLYCIRVLRSVTASGEESVNQDLCDQGLINQLLGKFYLRLPILCRLNVLNSLKKTTTFFFF